MALRQAESEVRGKGKEGAKIIVGEAHESNWAAEELELQIRGFKRSHREVEGDLLLGMDGHVFINLQS